MPGLSEYIDLVEIIFEDVVFHVKENNTAPTFRVSYCVCTGLPCIEIEPLNLFSFVVDLKVGKL